MRDKTLGFRFSTIDSNIPHFLVSCRAKINEREGERGCVSPHFRNWSFFRYAFSLPIRDEKERSRLSINKIILPRFRLLGAFFGHSRKALRNDVAVRQESGGAERRRNALIVRPSAPRGKNETEKENESGRERGRGGGEGERAGPLRRPNPCGLLYRLPIGWARFRPDVGRP